MAVFKVAELWIPPQIALVYRKPISYFAPFKFGFRRDMLLYPKKHALVTSVLHVVHIAKENLKISDSTRCKAIKP